MDPITKNQKGFSLVELIVSVAIVTIIATIAQSQYSAYRWRAIDGASKTELMLIYAKMTSFQSHFNTYFGDFRNIGYQCTGKLHSRVGFNSGTATCPLTYNGPGVAAGGSAVEMSSNTAGCEEDEITACALIASCTFSATSFTACAATKVEGYDTNQKKVITIDQGKSIGSTIVTQACGI